MKHNTAVTLALLLAFLTVTSVASAAARYCGTGTSRSGATITRYVGPAWDRPGYRQMQKRAYWSATPTYYVCKP